MSPTEAVRALVSSRPSAVTGRPMASRSASRVLTGSSLPSGTLLAWGDDPGNLHVSGGSYGTRRPWPDIKRCGHRLGFGQRSGTMVASHERAGGRGLR